MASPLGPRKSGLPDLRRLTADLGQARDRCLAEFTLGPRTARTRGLAGDTSARSRGARSGPVGRRLITFTQPAHAGLVSRPSAERRSRTEREPGSSATTRAAAIWLPAAIRVAPGPGSRCARPGHEESRLANEPLAVSRIHDVKQRSVVRSRGALLRPGLSLVFASIPERGVGGAPIRHPHIPTSPQVAPGHSEGSRYLALCPPQDASTIPWVRR